MQKWLVPLITVLILSLACFSSTFAQTDLRFPIAVFPFVHGNDISRGEMEKFTDALRQQLVESGRYEVVDHDRFKDIMRDLDLHHWEPVPDSLFEQVAHSLGAKLVIQGKMDRRPDGGITINAVISDVESKREKKIAEVSGPPGADVGMLARSIVNNIFLEIDTDKYITFGLQYFKNKNYERAEENFRKVIELDPAQVTAWYYLGNTLLEEGDTLAAIADYDTALSRDPEYADAYARLAAVYQNRNQVAEAEKAFSRLLELDPDNLSYRLNYASVLFKNQMFDDSIEQYREAIQIDSSNVNAWVGLGLTYYKLEAWKNAVNPLEKASELSPGDLNTLIYLAATYNHLGDYRGAVSAYERIVKYDPGYPKAYLNLGLFYKRLKMNDKAIEAFRNGVEHSPEEDKGELYLALADALNEAKQYREAVSAIDKALAKGANKRRCYMIEADAYQGWGESLESTDTIESYLEAITYYTRSNEAYSQVVDDPKFGKYARDNIERNKELIKRAELIIKKKELGG